MHLPAFSLLLLMTAANLADATRTVHGQTSNPPAYPDCYSIRLIGFSAPALAGSQYYTYDMIDSRNTYYKPNFVSGHSTGNQKDNYIGVSAAAICGCCLTGLHVIAVNQHHDIDDRFNTDGSYLSIDCDYTHGHGVGLVGKFQGSPWNNNILSARYAGTPSSYSRIGHLSMVGTLEGYDFFTHRVNTATHANSTSASQSDIEVRSNPSCGNGPST